MRSGSKNKSVDQVIHSVPEFFLIKKKVTLTHYLKVIHAKAVEKKIQINTKQNLNPKNQGLKNGVSLLHFFSVKIKGSCEAGKTEVFLKNCHVKKTLLIGTKTQNAQRESDLTKSFNYYYIKATPNTSLFFSSSFLVH